MKILFATKNPAKIQRYVGKLEEKGIKVVTLKDLNIDVDVNENGKNALENAEIKARAYYNATNLVTIGIDDNLYIEELPEDRQIGTHVRRINGKYLNDDEMIEYYTGLAKEFGGKLTAKWVYGLVMYDGKNTKQYTWSKDKCYIIDKPCKEINKGYPLNSITIVPETGKYFAQMTEEEKSKKSYASKDDEVIEFIVKNL